jgi:hypothetical protein
MQGPRTDSAGWGLLCPWSAEHGSSPAKLSAPWEADKCPGCVLAGSRPPPASIYHAIFAILTDREHERWLSPLFAQQPAFLQRSCDLIHFFTIISQTSGTPPCAASAAVLRHGTPQCVLQQAGRLLLWVCTA